MKEKININNKYMNILNFRKLFFKMYILNKRKNKIKNILGNRDVKLLVMN